MPLPVCGKTKTKMLEAARRFITGPIKKTPGVKVS